MDSIKGLKRGVKELLRGSRRLIKYGRYRKSDPRVLTDALEIIPEAWLFAGTLLGAIRNNQIIKWDGDIDIGCSCRNVSQETVKRFQQAGFTVKAVYTLDDPRLEQYIPDHIGDIGKIVLERDESKLEICCFASGKFNKHLNCDVEYFGGNGNRLFILPKKFIYPLEQMDFYGSRVNVPKDFEGQLSFIYGPDWRVPRRDWYCTADHYLCRERTIIELGEDDGSKWSKWTGRRVIGEAHGVEAFPEDINEPFVLQAPAS